MIVALYVFVLYSYYPLDLSAISESQYIPKGGISFASAANKSDSLTSPTQQRPTIESLNWYLWQEFSLYGITDQLPKARAVINCESTWNPNVGWSWNHSSLGLVQFTAATWKDYGTGRYLDANPYDQIATMAKMWKLGLQHRWNCY